jgi:hypothetical protein
VGRLKKSTSDGLSNDGKLKPHATSPLAEQTAPAFAGGTALNTHRFSIPIHSLKPKNTMANFISAVEHHFHADVVKEIRKILEGESSGVLYTQEV